MQTHKTGIEVETKREPSADLTPPSNSFAHLQQAGLLGSFLDPLPPGSKHRHPPLFPLQSHLALHAYMRGRIVPREKEEPEREGGFDRDSQTDKQIDSEKYPGPRRIFNEQNNQDQSPEWRICWPIDRSTDRQTDAIRLNGTRTLHI